MAFLLAPLSLTRACLPASWNASGSSTVSPEPIGLSRRYSLGRFCARLSLVISISFMATAAFMHSCTSR